MARGEPQSRVPKQKRSEQTRAKLMEAGKRLFCEEGYHATSSKKIARAAGISVGSFYNYFADKKDLLLEVHRQHATKVHDMVQRAITEADLANPELDARAFVRGFVDHAVQLHDLDPALHRQITSLTYSDPEFGELARQEEEAALQALLEVLEPHRAHMQVDDLEATARVVGQTLEGVIHSMILFEPSIEKERLLDALADIITKGLFGLR